MAIRGAFAHPLPPRVSRAVRLRRQSGKKSRPLLRTNVHLELNSFHTTSKIKKRRHRLGTRLPAGRGRPNTKLVAITFHGAVRESQLASLSGLEVIIQKQPHSSPPTAALRTDSPVSNVCSHGTFPHFSLQNPPLNTRYCHQDLHQGPFQSRSRANLLHF